MLLRQNIHISIAMMQPWKKPFRKVKALEFGTRDTLGSAFETRTATGREHSVCQDSGVSHIGILIIHNREKVFSIVNVMEWVRVIRENSSLPLPVRVSKSRVLKLPNDSRSVVSTLVYNGKLANQNARLVAIVTIHGGEQVSRVLVTSGSDNEKLVWCKG